MFLMSEVLLYGVAGALSGQEGGAGASETRTPPPYRGTSLVRRRTPLQGHPAHKKQPLFRTLPQPYAQGPMVFLVGGGRFLMSEVPLYRVISLVRRRTPLTKYVPRRTGCGWRALYQLITLRPPGLLG